MGFDLERTGTTSGSGTGRRSKSRVRCTNTRTASLVTGRSIASTTRSSGVTTA